ncbi:hypothetical protein F4779DRAFT_612302 [Xylariaceae sp. FL0662B]|nr:hypothetical protein F4779DRAFT_612302 [Xylariaceae sp. FL0662B]
MSVFFLGETDTPDPNKKTSGVQRRPRAASDSPSPERTDTSKQPRPPTPPPRRSSWAFSRRHSYQYNTAPPKSTKPSLRRKSKWSSLNFPFKFQDPQKPRSQPPQGIIMSSPTKTSPPTLGDRTAVTGPNREHGHSVGPTLPMPGLSGKANGPVGNLLKGPVDADGNLKDAALMVGVKLDLEAEVHLTARVRGDILVGLY